MKKDLNSKRKSSGSKNEPMDIGEVLNDYLRSNEPLAIAFRNRKAKSEAAKTTEAKVETAQLFRDLFPDTHLCVDLKLLTHQQERIHVGAYLNGTITRNGEDTFLFIEKDSVKKVKTVQRNPVIFTGGCVNVHLLADGTKRLEFNRPRFYATFTFRDFCVAAAQELLTIAQLFGEENLEK